MSTAKTSKDPATKKSQEKLKTSQDMLYKPQWIIPSTPCREEATLQLPRASRAIKEILKVDRILMISVKNQV